MMVNLQTVPATIAAGESLSDAVDLTIRSIVCIVMPDDWLMAPLSFEASIDGTLWKPLCYATTGEVFLVVYPSTAVIVPPELSKSFNFLKLRSGMARQPVVQPADRVFGIAVSQ